MSLQNRRTDAFIMLHHTVRSWIIIRAQLKLLWGTDGQLAKMRDQNRIRLEEKRTWGSADSWETIIIIFCHLFGKLQILLLPFSSLLSTHADNLSTSCFSEASVHSDRVSVSPQPTPDPCCTPWVGISWPAQKRVDSVNSTQVNRSGSHAHLTTTAIQSNGFTNLYATILKQSVQ